MTWIARVGINHLQDDGTEARYEAGDVVPDAIATANDWLAAQGWIEKDATPDKVPASITPPVIVVDPEPDAPVAMPEPVAEEVANG